MSAAGLWMYRVRAAVERLGRVGGLGVALLAGCAVFYVSAVVPATDELESVLQRRASEDLARRSGRVALDTQGQLREFVAFFPELDTSSRWLAIVFAAAKDEGLELAQGTYRLHSDDVIGLVSYQVTLPVRGPYPRIRRFLGRVLTEVPAASLDNVSFQRERSADGAVDARVVIALHLRDSPGGGGQPAPPAEPLRQEAQREGDDRVLARAEGVK